MDEKSNPALCRIAPLKVGSHLKSWKRLVHRQIWQRLPRKMRRNATFFLAEKLAPKPGPRPEAISGPLYVAGPLRTASGLGAAARLSLECLREAGFDAWGVDLSLEIDPKYQDFEFAEAPIAEGSGIIILQVNGLLTAMAMAQLGRKNIRDKLVIGCWAWELSDLPREWLPGLRFVHEIWVPSRFVRDAVAGRTTLPVRILPYPLPRRKANTNRSATEGETSKTTVLVAFDMASSFERKNPLAAIAAFRKAFDDDLDWQLIVKINDADSYPPGRDAVAAAVYGAKNISVIEKTLSRMEMEQLQHSADIVLSLHRSEGFGLILAEAMQRGQVAVATNWSGNTDFMSAENSRLVAFDLIPAKDPQGTYHHPKSVWAAPDVSDAARHLIALKDPVLRAQLGHRAKIDASEYCSLENYVNSVARFLNLPQMRPPR